MPDLVTASTPNSELTFGKNRLSGNKKKIFFKN